MESCDRKKPANALPKHSYCRAYMHSHEVTSEAAVRQRGRLSASQAYSATRRRELYTSGTAEPRNAEARGAEVFRESCLRW